MGSLRALGLGAVTSLVAGVLGAVAAPSAHAVDPAFPGPTSGHWSVLLKTVDGVTRPATENREKPNDMPAAHLNLTPLDSTLNPTTGGSVKPETAYVYVDLNFVYFRVHTAALPADAPGGYVVQIDTDGNTAGWNVAVRYDDQANAITVHTAANKPVDNDGVPAATVPATAGNATSYTAHEGGAYVAWAVSRADLAAHGATLAGPVRLVVGTTADEGAGISAAESLLSAPSGDVLGHETWPVLGAPEWGTLAVDPVQLAATDNDSDGVVDGIDNCPNVANPAQLDDDADGRGNACDQTPRGDDPDGDGVGALDDKCPEQPGALSNGCPAQSTTTLTMRYVAKTRRFKGTARADYDQCLPRRTVTVFRIISGPDRVIRTVRTDSAGRYALPRLARRPKAGRYYARVDSRWTIGARCFADKAPAITIR